MYIIPPPYNSKITSSRPLLSHDLIDTPRPIAWISAASSSRRGDIYNKRLTTRESTRSIKLNPADAMCRGEINDYQQPDGVLAWVRHTQEIMSLQQYLSTKSFMIPVWKQKITWNHKDQKFNKNSERKRKAESAQ